MEERVYTVPMETEKVSREKRAGKAVKNLKKYLSRHLNVSKDQVYIDPRLNEEIWSRGRRKPPSKLKVRAMKFDDGVVEATPFEEE